MKYIYLDSNIITAIKKAETEPFISISKCLEQLKNDVVIPYSTAHMADLKKGYKEDESSIKYTNLDLEFLYKLSMGIHLYYDAKENIVTVIQRNPLDVFESYKGEDITAEEAMNFEKLFAGIEGLEFIGTYMNNLFTNMQVPLDLSKIPDDSPLKKSLQDIFQTTGETTSMMTLMKGLAKFSDEIHTDPTKYKELRNGFRNALELPKDISNWKENTWDKLDAHMSSTMLNKSFTNMVADATTQQGKDKKITFHDEFLQAYMNLDLVGFNPEELNKKNTYTNFFNDSQHSFFAKSCDVFVTNDKGTYAKSKVIYEKYGIKTNVLNAQEFLKKLIPKMTTIELFNTAPNGIKIDYLLLTKVPNADNSGFDYRVEYIDRLDDNKTTFVGVFDLILGYIAFEKIKGLGIPHTAIKLLIEWIDNNLEE